MEPWQGAIFSAPAQGSPGAHPASHTMATGSFSGIKQLGRGVDNPLPPSPEVKERVVINLFPLWACSRANFTFSLDLCIYDTQQMTHIRPQYDSHFSTCSTLASMLISWHR